MAFSGILLEEDKVECRPDRITNAIIDDSVDVHQIRRYLTNDAWMIVQDIIERKKACAVWSCKACCHDLEEKLSIACESCLEWYSRPSIIQTPTVTKQVKFTG
jgi:hypothetical protein